MSKIQLNDDMADKGPMEVIPEGIHAFTVKAVGDVSMSQNQKEYLPIEIEIEGINLKEKLFLTKESHWRVARFLKSLKGGQSLGDMEFDPERCKWIVGKTGQCLIEHEIPTEGKYAGKRFARVKNYEWGHALTGASSAPEENDDPPF